MKSGFRLYIGIMLCLLYPCCLFAAPLVSGYDLSVILHPEKHLIEGRAVIILHAAGAASLILKINPGAEIQKVEVNGGGVDFGFSHGSIDLRVPGMNWNVPVRIAVEYRCVFADRPPRQQYASDNPASGAEGIIGAQGTFLLPGAGWYPRIPEAKFPLTLTVNGPEGVEAVTAGERVERSTRDGVTTSIWKVVHETDDLALAAGKYLVNEMRVEDISVYTYFFADDSHLSEAYLGAAGKYLRMYTALFGPYAFPKFAVVENFLPTGYGFPSYTLLGRSVIRLPFILDTSLGHEVAHCWWGNGVLVDYSSGNWSEGLTTYVADHYYQELSSPAKAMEYRLKILRDYATLVYPERDFPLRDFVSRTDPATSAVGYGKGAMVFHMVRKRIGDQSFRVALRDVFREKVFRKASWEDFASAFGWRAGEDLHPFFHQWVDGTGAPLLSLQSVRAEKTAEGWNVTGMLTQSGSLFDLLVPVRVETPSGEQEKSIHLRGNRAAFSFTVAGRPSRLLVDPEVDVFRLLHGEEMVPIVNSVRGSSSLVVVTAEDTPSSMRELLGVLLESLGQGKAAVVSESQVETADLGGRDVLFAGLPRKRELLPRMPSGLDLDGHGFSVNGKAYRDPMDCLFAVVRHPADQTRVAAVFLPLSVQAAKSAIPKILHYGKYSYLVFREGVNAEKGIWPVRRSPLIHVFDRAE